MVECEDDYSKIKIFFILTSLFSIVPVDDMEIEEDYSNYIEEIPIPMKR